MTQDNCPRTTQKDAEEYLNLLQSRLDSLLKEVTQLEQHAHNLDKLQAIKEKVARLKEIATHLEELQDDWSPSPEKNIQELYVIDFNVKKITAY